MFVLLLFQCWVQYLEWPFMMITAKRLQDIARSLVDGSGEAAEPVEKEGWVEFTLYMCIYIYT